jgi:hypothetical protein
MYGLLIRNRFLHHNPAITEGNAKKNSRSFTFFLHSKQKTKQNNDTDKTEGNQGKQQASPTMLSLSSGMVSSCPGTKQMELRDKNGRYSCCFMFLHSKL